MELKKFSTYIKESTKINHERYRRSHMKNAKPSTHGMWMFTNKASGSPDWNDEDEFFEFSGKGSEAFKAAKEWGTKRGYSDVYVMESVNEAKTTYNNPKVEARYQELKSMSKAALVKERQRHHKVSDEAEVKRMMKGWIITDILEAEFGRKKMEESKSATGYEIYHKTFSSAVQHAQSQVEKEGYTIDPEEWDNKVALGPRKPSKGKTNTYTIDLLKNGKETRRKLKMQVYYDEGRFELNMYIS